MTQIDRPFSSELDITPMFALFVALHAGETPSYTTDIICYEHTSGICPKFQPQVAASGGETVGTESAVHLGQFIYAAPSNASSALAKSNAQVVMFLVQDDMSGKDQDMFDLAVLSGNVMLVFAPKISDEQFQSMLMKNPLVEIGKVKNIGTRDGFASMEKAAQAFAQLAALGSFDIKRSIKDHLAQQCPDFAPEAAVVHLTATSDVFRKGQRY